jgi:hypothetical protein
VYLGKPFRSKGFESRKCLIALSILTHNLWLIASKSREALYAQQNVAWIRYNSVCIGRGVSAQRFRALIDVRA